jgi:hypothetical protein
MLCIIYFPLTLLFHFLRHQPSGERRFEAV